MPKQLCQNTSALALPGIIGEGIDVIYFNGPAEIIKNCLMSFFTDLDLYDKVFMKWNIYNPNKVKPDLMKLPVNSTFTSLGFFPSVWFTQSFLISVNSNCPQWFSEQSKVIFCN